jgi:CDP-diacylglycerol--glycerol-3-phosphate 3-phosphatidyltransferase
MPGVGAVTVAERPIRIVLPAVAAVGTAVWPDGTPLTQWPWATLCAGLWVVVAVVGLAQLGVAVIRHIPTG